MVYTIDELGRKIAPVAEKYQIPKVWIFGSYARGQADEKSDIDLVINYDASNAKGLRFISAAIDFEKAVGRPVDLLDEDGLNSSTTYLAKRVKEGYEKERILIYEKKQRSTRP